LAVLQARIDVLDPRLHALHFAAGFGLQASDQRADVLGRLRRALRQGAYFPGDHGETAPMLTGTGRLDGRIEGQQVGLRGDVGDQPDDAVDFRHAAVQALYAEGGTFHHVADRAGTVAHLLEAFARASHHRVHGAF